MGAPSNAPTTRPWFARNSAMISAFQPFVSATSCSSSPASQSHVTRNRRRSFRARQLTESQGTTLRWTPTPKAGLPPMSTTPDESPATRSTARSTLPARARVVVIGGGVIGCSVAYHLAQMGCPDVVLLERDRLTSGTTWHAAGLMVTFGSTSQTSTEMRKYTRDLYARLEAETGLATGFNPVGFIEIATEPDRLEEYRRVSAFNRYCGVDVQEIPAAELGRLFPLARTDDILAGFYVKEDGRVNPVDVTMSLAKGARLRGAKIIEGVAVTDVLERGGVVTGGGGVVTGVRTDQGDIE